MLKTQPLSAKLAEIKFRQKLVRQHLGKESFEVNEPDQKEILEILKQRVDKSREIFKKLSNNGVPLSPFLEIGAEKSQRAMILVNEFKGGGFAADISFDSLAVAPKFARMLGFNKLPKLICCDAYSLPFADNSFPFVFCFETLHHFPHPKPVIEEIHRVLIPGGVFYFGEEPIKQIFNLNLWRRGYHLTTFEKLLKVTGLLPFLSRIGKTETKHGILEEEFTLDTWKQALSNFAYVQTNIQPVFFGPVSYLTKFNNSWKNPPLLTQILIALQGGGIQGYGKKKGKTKTYKDINNSFLCPDCKKNIIRQNQSFYCSRCKRKFNKKGDVFIFLPLKLQKSFDDQ